MPDEMLRYLNRAARLGGSLIRLADDAERGRLDNSCRILYGIVRDMGYRLRRLASEEAARRRAAAAEEEV
ncbi:MAG: hypothetical protein GYA21_03630 [Myxococcales bacterium]|nr:hypothetical protein [Myxococcales bacterium]